MPSKSNYLNKGLDFTKQSEIHETIRANGVKIDSHNTAQTATNTKLDNLSGAPNNNLGMGASKLQVYPYGHDTVNDVMKPLKLDASGRLECSVDALEITADTINLSTNELETKVDAVTSKLDTFAGAASNNIGTGASKLQTFPYGKDSANDIMRPIKVDAIGKVIVDSPSGSDLCLRLDAIQTAVQVIDNAISGNEMQCDIVSGAVTVSGVSTEAKQGAGLPSALSSDNLKVSLKETIDVPVTNAGLTELAAAINSNKMDVNLVSGGFDGAVSNAHLTELGTAINSAKVDVNLVSGGFDGAVTNSGLTELAAAINSNKMDVNIVSGNISGFATSALQTDMESSLDSILSKNGEIESSLNSLISANHTDLLAIDGSINTIEACVGSSKVNVNISSGGFDGAVTNAGLTELAAAINTNRVDVNIANGGFDGAVTNSGLTELAAAINSNKMDVNIVSGNISGFATSALQTDMESSLDSILSKNGEIESSLNSLISANHTDLVAVDAVLDTIKIDTEAIETATEKAVNGGTTGEWLSSASINDDAFAASAFDASAYKTVRFMGKSTSDIGFGGLMLLGSQTESGTYYNLGGAEKITPTTIAIGGSNEFHIFAVIENCPNFIKLYNNTGSSKTIELDYIGYCN